MNVYIAFGYIDYEGSDALGVFSTREDAERYIARYKKKEKGSTRRNYNSYFVENHVVDDPALAFKADGA